MIKGKGRLNLRDGRRVEVVYHIAEAADDRRAGHVFFDTTPYDDVLFATRLVLECDDGTLMIFAVVNRTARSLGIHGRLMLPSLVEASPEASPQMH